MEIGIYSFAEATTDPTTGKVPDASTRLRQLIEEIECAEQAGLDVFGVGEHHRDDYTSSAPAVVLAAAAARTERIRLTSAVTVLSSDDPVRVMESFSTVDALSAGRAEIMVGRGSFVESFPLFGYDLRDYDALFDEKLRLLLRLRDEERVSWRGRFRAPLADAVVHPPTTQPRLPVWVAVGGNPPSVERAASLGLPMALAIIGGRWAQFGPLADHYRVVAAQAGHDPASLPLSINGHGWIDTDSRRAADASFPAAAETMNRIGAERGWPPFSRSDYEAARSPQGAWFVGDPDEVAAKAVAQHQRFGHQRLLLQLTVGTMPHEQVLRSIELLGREVAPRVREAVAERA